MIACQCTGCGENFSAEPIGGHRLLCGDATSRNDVTTCIGSSTPNLMVTDPPYGVDYDPGWRSKVLGKRTSKKMGKVANDDRADWREAWELFPGSVVYCWHGAWHASTVQVSLESVGFAVVSQIIWVKDRFALSRGDYHWQHETCWYVVRKGSKHAWQGGRSQSTTWMIPAREDSGHGHGTQKPIECMKRPIENNSRVGDAVYDPFSGSFTTGIACELTGRKFLGIEIEPAYVELGILRWQNFTGKIATHAKTGKTFDQTALAGRSTGRVRGDALQGAALASSRQDYPDRH